MVRRADAPGIREVTDQPPAGTAWHWQTARLRLGFDAATVSPPDPVATHRLRPDFP
jgi:hypothetical protein